VSGPHAGTAAWRIPTRLTALWFTVRVAAHMALRACRNLWHPVPRHRRSTRLADAPVTAQSRSALWTDGRPEEWVLVAGKVHNLRLACRHFDGLLVPAGTTLSFWRQLGRPSRLRGFVEGREVREGCVVPTVAGGLCQLSNALARCAIDAGLDVVERHRHTGLVQGHTTLPDGNDATVFWNYVDLRVVARGDLRIEAELSADELIVRFRSLDPAPPARRVSGTVIPLHPVPGPLAPQPVARGCLTCDETACFRHPPERAHWGTVGLWPGRFALRTARRAQAQASTAVLVDEWTPEFAAYLAAHEAGATWLLPWPLRRGGPRWVGSWASSTSIARAASLWRAVATRWHTWGPGNAGGRRQAAVLAGRHTLAASYARQLRPEHQRVVVEQGLLAPLQALGALGGRQVEVLARELPMAEVQKRLDAAHVRWPQSATLVDFRAATQALADEAAALQRVGHLVTPHAGVAAHARRHAPGLRITQIPWHLPTPPAAHQPRAMPARPAVVFPASALARKGADDLAAVLRELGWPLLVPSRGALDAPVWQGIEVRHTSDWLERGDLVVLPAYVEHAPRAALRALSHGLPVVVSTGCGLSGLPGVVEVEAGDRAALTQALLGLASRPPRV